MQASDPESCRCVALCTTRGLISVDESDWPGSIKAAQQWASGGGRVLDAAAAGSGTGTSTPHFLLLWGAGLLVRAPLPSGTDSGGLTGQSSIEIKRNTWRCPQEKPGYYPPPRPPRSAYRAAARHTTTKIRQTDTSTVYLFPLLVPLQLKNATVEVKQDSRNLQNPSISSINSATPG